jgi:uncharacterized membrane protein
LNGTKHTPMRKATKTAIKQAIGLGAVAGLRATVAPAAISHYLSNHPRPDSTLSKLSFIQSPITAIITKVLSAAEITGDKLPSTPNRTTLPQVAARVASGALVGATIFRSNRESAVRGMLIGGASALLATYASFYIRKSLDKVPHVKDWYVAVVEDAIAISSSTALTHTK